ncbi:hypothetical protein WAI453_005361 [Rhynchosporium graminicola]
MLPIYRRIQAAILNQKPSHKSIPSLCTNNNNARSAYGRIIPRNISSWLNTRAFSSRSTLEKGPHPRVAINHTVEEAPFIHIRIYDT